VFGAVPIPPYGPGPTPGSNTGARCTTAVVTSIDSTLNESSAGLWKVRCIGRHPSLSGWLTLAAKWGFRALWRVRDSRHCSMRFQMPKARPPMPATMPVITPIVVKSGTQRPRFQRKKRSALSLNVFSVRRCVAVSNALLAMATLVGNSEAVDAHAIRHFRGQPATRNAHRRRHRAAARRRGANQTAAPLRKATQPVYRHLRRCISTRALLIPVHREAYHCPKAASLNCSSIFWIARHIRTERPVVR
jgi:hypothetical protein